MRRWEAYQRHYGPWLAHRTDPPQWPVLYVAHEQDIREAPPEEERSGWRIVGGWCFRPYTGTPHAGPAMFGIETESGWRTWQGLADTYARALGGELDGLELPGGDEDGPGSLCEDEA